jgi:probable HAF family extracellular repeat protein
VLLLVTASATAAHGLGGAERHASRSEQWVVTRLGLLGSRSTLATAINDRGQVVGMSGGHAFLWQGGRLTDLGTFGGPYSYATAINDRGDIVGVAENRFGTRDCQVLDSSGELGCDGCLVTSARQAGATGFMWRNGVMTNLGRCNFPTAINDRGQVVGRTEAPQVSSRTFVWQGGRFTTLSQAGEAVDAVGVSGLGQVIANAMNGGVCDSVFLWLDGQKTDLPQGMCAVLVGASGQVVLNGPGAMSNSQGFLWENGAVSPLGWAPDARFASASAMNDQAEIVGTCQTPNQARPCVWVNGDVSVLPTPFGGVAGRALGINQAGQIVGRVSLGSPSGKSAAVVWQDGHATRLPPLRTGDWSEATAINNHGQIIGDSEPSRFAPKQAVIWQLAK